ncbi:MAG: hypothetical protein K0U47_02675 [Epsilonproteobacteria bacterium]|nr:hypothetical protein [Campylobacterota bacterium]
MDNLKKLITKTTNLLLGTNISKIVSILILFLIVYLAYSVKTIPDYRKKSGFDIVWKSDHVKYQQGYCLSENRILSEEEILRKALTQYFTKTIKLSQNIEDFRVHYYGRRSKLYWQFDQTKYNFEKPKIAYYSLENLNVENFNDQFLKKYNFENTRTGLLELFFDKFNAKEINPMDIIHIKGGTAYFSKPVFWLSEREFYTIFLKEFKVRKSREGYELLENSEGLSEGFGKRRIEYYLQHYARDEGYYDLKIDNCGNLDFNIEKIFEEVKFLTGG